MAKNPREYIGDTLDALRDGLGPFVARQYKMRFSGKRYLQEIDATLNSHSFSVQVTDETSLKDIDALGWLNLIIRRWDEAFYKKLGAAVRSYANELRETRHDWAHQRQRFTNEEAKRFCDTAKLLLQAVNATDQAALVNRFHQDLSRDHFERQAASAAKEPPRRHRDASRTTHAGLKPWREIIEPHPDVRSGRFLQAEFAADLAAVMRGEAQPEYQQAKEFFDRTYMTEGLLDLLENGIKRLTGAGGDPVVQLQTNFGGGKTHSLLALYHAFGEDFKLSGIRDLADVPKLLDAIDDDLQARRAVIVGTSFNVSQPRQYSSCTTRTVWGEIAYQLGGSAGFELVSQNDLEGTNPGADTLVQLLEKHGPALIIMDELVRLTQNVYRVEPAPAAGSFESILAFMQSLTEAVKRTSDALLLVAVPASEATADESQLSEIEIGGEGGYTTLRQLRQTLGRLEAVWKPVSAEESYEIVRRRLFADVSDFPARDAVVNAFYRMYGESRSDFPPEVSEVEYKRRMTQAYPIHPEFFERLYEDWSTLERFQRTRGVLRMMASVIHQLWIDGDQALMIMPGAVPMWNKTVESEITKYLLPRNYSPVIAADIDGTGSKPYQIDQAVTQLGKHGASRKVARAIFIGSSPTKQMRGITERRINLATVQPDERAGVFGDALRRMSSQLTYLYTNGTHYWYETRATVNRTAEDRAQNMDRYHVLDEAEKRLRAQPWDRAALGSAHILPESSAEVPDEASVRVIVLGPDHPHKNNDSASAAMRECDAILRNRGSSPRHHRNMLVFIAPDDSRNAEWEDSIRKYLAWKSIQRDAAMLNLDHQQSKQVEESLKRATETVDDRLQETYAWLIVPTQEKQDNGDSSPVTLEQERLTGKSPFLERAARKLYGNEWLIREMSPEYLMGELEHLNIWQDAPHLKIKTLWEWLTKYAYLPRLFDRSVLENTIKQGVNRIGPAFAYATAVDDAGKYSGLTMGHPFTLYFDGSDLIVKRELAQAQLQAERPPTPEPDEQLVIDRGRPAPISPSPPADPPPPQRKTRYYGSVKLEPQRATRDFDLISKEIIAQLIALPGVKLSITLEIACERHEGFDESLIRAISENSATLKFDAHGFEG